MASLKFLSRRSLRFFSNCQVFFDFFAKIIQTANRAVWIFAYLNEIRHSPEVLIWPYKGLLLASPSRGTEFYFTCIFCTTARKRAIYVLLVANSFIKTSTCSSLRSMLKAKAFTGCLHRQSRWFLYPIKPQLRWFMLGSVKTDYPILLP